MTRRAAFLAGVAASVPIIIGYLPIAFSFGAIALQSRLTLWQSLLVSSAVFAGASQFMLVALAAAGSPAWTMLSAVLLMNVRHVFYGPSLAALLGRSAFHSRVPPPVIAFGLTDEVFATASSKGGRIPLHVWDLWLLGLELGAYLSWVLGTALGASFGASVMKQPGPLRNGLTFALPALFCALLAESYVSRHQRVLVVASVVALAAVTVMPSHMAMLTGMVAGAASSLTPGRRLDPI